MNEAEFHPHIVEYRLPPQLSEYGTQDEQMERDLERLARMGANAILFHNDDRKSEGQEKTGQDNAGQKNGVRQNPGNRSFLQVMPETWIFGKRPVDNRRKNPHIPWITRRNYAGDVAFGGRQDVDGALLLLSGEME